ncbi:hypothetical protein CLOP_g4437, partial [Closterium sp. NIES-67]
LPPSGNHGILQTISAARILENKNGGQFHLQNCLPNSVRVVRVSGNAVRTHQRTGNVPSQNEPHSMPTLGQMRGGVQRFYVKLSNSEFALKKVQFLGHMVSAQGVHVDPKKIAVVHMWKTPKNVKELQQLLGFANYYNRLVSQNAKIAAPLTNPLKKNMPYKWEPKHQEVIEQLKQALTSAPVLILPDLERDYVIEADASDQAAGALSMQGQGNGQQPIVYLNKKLRRAELNYPIHDKEALAITIAFKTWRCYLEGRKTTIYTNHCNVKYSDGKYCPDNCLKTFLQ